MMTKQLYRAHVEAMIGAGMKPQFPQMVCMDGATVSVQASAVHYCNPRNDEGPYTTVEAGFPSIAPPDSWIEHAEDPDDLCGTVYGHLTAEHINEFINAHGGLDIGRML